MKEERLKRSAKIINRVTRVVSTTLAVIFLLYGGLSLWDMYRSEMKAFASFDLLQYRPSLKDDPPYLEEMLKINPDVAAWLTIYNTRIDYPVVQGKDDMEYVNKDASGQYALWGSLFISEKNKTDFSDPYTLIYGHHVSNGTMFGDIEKFEDRKFFNASKGGVIVLQEKVYDLDVFAFLEVSAYDEQIYNPDSRDMKELLGYIKDNAIYYKPLDINRLVAFSTCQDGTTDGRMVLFCNLTPRTKPYSRPEELKSSQRQAIGHPMAGAYWALLNLVCMLITVYAAVPIHLIRKKKWKSKNTIYGIMTALVSMLLFFLTENPHKPIQITDVWTLPMIILMCICWYFIKEKRKE